MNCYYFKLYNKSYNKIYKFSQYNLNFIYRIEIIIFLLIC